MSKFYIATRLSRVKDHNTVRDALLLAGHTLTYDWTTHGNVKNVSHERLREVAHNEFDAVRSAETVIFLLPGGVGTHVELGAALALGKHVILHSEDPALFQLGEKTCAFYHHDRLTQYCGSIKEFIEFFLCTQEHARVLT